MTRLAALGPQSRTAALILAAGLAAFAAPGHSRAEEPATQNQGAPPPVQDDGRYTFHRSGEGFLRLDSHTGQLALCGWGPTGWSCKMVPDERTALESEIARLQRDNAALKQSLLSRGIELPSGMMAEAPAPGPVPPASVPDPSAKEPKMPSDAELDRAITFMKNVWRKLVDMMVDLQRDMQRKS
ncbi:MAG: hypothetical protein QOF09_3105 [Alphaproteobacteria bacterium]|jgi:hypothetical protein|nr:hypothetical protein [Alphaproteobacteria bacterium]